MKHIPRKLPPIEGVADETPWEPGVFIAVLNILPLSLCMWALIIGAFAFWMGWLR